jgi:hypothetical protein
MRKLLVILITTLIISIISVNSYANVSSAAILFLRIAAGARAAGMGEAFVAVADDATATHWNPAGLGNYPLSSKWFELNVPQQYRPLKKFVLFKNEGSNIDYRQYDIWALSPMGIVKCDDKGVWTQGDLIEAGANRTVESIIRQYTGLAGDSADARTPALVEKIARANNLYPPQRIDSLREGVMKALKEDYKGKDDIDKAFIALNQAYNQCLIDWEILNKAYETYRNSIKDSAIDASEADKILFALEKSKRRILLPTIVVPFDINFSGQINDIAADDNFLWVAVESGLYRYNGKNWQHFGTDNGLPTNNIKIIRLFNKKAYLGTDAGLVIYDGGAFKYPGDSLGLPQKPIAGIAAAGDNDVWVLVERDLYHYDGSVWKNYFEYRDVLGGTESALYEHMNLYWTSDGKERFLAKYTELNSSIDTTAPAAIPQSSTIEDSSAKTDTSKANAEMDSLKTGTKTTPPGRLVRVPYMAGLEFAPTDINVDGHGGVWIGTEYGLFRFAGHKWTRFGYREYTPENDISVIDLAKERVKGDSVRAVRLAENIKAVNNLTSDIIPAKNTVRIYANPAGAKIFQISPMGDKIFFATESGTIYFDGRWARYNAEDLADKNIYGIEERSNSVWFAAADAIMIKGGARSEIAMMHANWLPELANDIYYEFFSYVKNVEGWGTVGGNITFLSYGTIARTDESGNSEGDFQAFDIALTLSYGTAISPSLSGGISAKVFYSHLSPLGAGKEKGTGKSTGLALDVGIIYKLQRRINLGVAITNIGPDVSYIDVAQSDPLPRNLAVGLAWKAIESSYNKVLFTAEANKSLVGMSDGFSEELKEVVLSGGAEYWYGSFIAFRGGYIYDQEGEIKTPTLGFGLAYRLFHFDFAYIPSNDQVALANTMRFSLSINM